MRRIFMFANVCISAVCFANVLFAMGPHDSAVEISPEDVVHIRNHVEAMDRDWPSDRHRRSRNFNFKGLKTKAGTIFEESDTCFVVVFKNIVPSFTFPEALIVCSEVDGRVNSHYSTLYLDLRDNLMRSLNTVLGSRKEPFELIFTGFRLGATLATLAVAELSKDLKYKNGLRLVTFSSLPAGERDFIDALNGRFPPKNAINFCARFLSWFPLFSVRESIGIQVELLPGESDRWLVHSLPAKSVLREVVASYQLASQSLDLGLEGSPELIQIGKVSLWSVSRGPLRFLGLAH